MSIEKVQQKLENWYFGPKKYRNGDIVSTNIITKTPFVPEEEKISNAHKKLAKDFQKGFQKDYKETQEYKENTTAAHTLLDIRKEEVSNAENRKIQKQQAKDYEYVVEQRKLKEHARKKALEILYNKNEHRWKPRQTHMKPQSPPSSDSEHDEDEDFVLKRSFKDVVTRTQPLRGTATSKHEISKETRERVTELYLNNKVLTADDQRVLDEMNQQSLAPFNRNNNKELHKRMNNAFFNKNSIDSLKPSNYVAFVIGPCDIAFGNLTNKSIHIIICTIDQSKMTRMQIRTNETLHVPDSSVTAIVLYECNPLEILNSVLFLNSQQRAELVFNSSTLLKNYDVNLEDVLLHGDKERTLKKYYTLHIKDNHVHQPLHLASL